MYIYNNVLNIKEVENIISTSFIIKNNELSLYSSLRRSKTGYWHAER